MSKVISQDTNTLYFFVILMFVMASFSVHSNSLDLTIVSEDQVNEVLSDSVVTIKDEEKDSRYKNIFHRDGTVTSKRSRGTIRGWWYTDGEGQHCIRWDHKNKSNCAVIMQDEFGHWVKVQDETIIRRYENIDRLE